jgi:hypothetical protein
MNTKPSVGTSKWYSNVRPLSGAGRTVRLLLAVPLLLQLPLFEPSVNPVDVTLLLIGVYLAITAVLARDPIAIAVASRRSSRRSSLRRNTPLPHVPLQGINGVYHTPARTPRTGGASR